MRVDAVLEDVAGEAVPREYAAARQSAALVDLSDRGVLAVSGPLRQKFLHGMLSNDVASRQPGEGCLAALMDVKGHLAAFMRVVVMPDVVRLEMPADRLETVERALVHYRVAAPVRFAVRPTAVLGLVGPDARSVLARAGAEVPELGPQSHVSTTLAGGDVLIARATDLPAGGFVVHVDPGGTAVWDALVSAGAIALGRPALDVLRVEDGRPWYGPDVTGENLLHETGLVREYHSSTKGCYVGQEIVARLEARGARVNKALCGLRLSSPAVAGTPVTVEGKEVGRVTTAGVSPRFGPIALAYVHRSHFAPGSIVTVGTAPATVTALPLEEATT